MKKSQITSHWGESPGTYDMKYEIHDVLSVYPPEKRFKLEMLQKFEEPSVNEEVPIESHLVTQTVELMNHTNRIKSVIELYNEEMVYMTNQRQVLPSITLSDETKTCLEEFERPIISPFESRPESDFRIGKPKTIIELRKPVVMEIIDKALAGLLRINGFDYITEGAMNMFKDGLEEFYICLMEKINHVMASNGTDVNKTLDVYSLDKAYNAIANSSILNLHNYYKNEIIYRNRSEIIRFDETRLYYEELVEESEKIQKVDLKGEHMNGTQNTTKTEMSASSSNANDSDASSFRDSNMSYDMKQHSDENTNFSFSMSQ